MPIQIKVLLFASAREAAGNVSSLELTLEDDDSNTAAFRKVLSVNIPKLSTLLQDEESLTLALNEEYVPSGEVLSLKDGDTIALIPPISGG